MLGLPCITGKASVIPEKSIAFISWGKKGNQSSKFLRKVKILSVINGVTIDKAVRCTT
jgi:hypothetical protein